MLSNWFGTNFSLILFEQHCLCCSHCDMRHDATVSNHTQIVCRSCASCMSHSHSSWLALPPFSHPPLLTSQILPSRGDHQPPDPRAAGLFGRVAIQSPLTCQGGFLTMMTTRGVEVCWWCHPQSGPKNAGGWHMLMI